MSRPPIDTAAAVRQLSSRISDQEVVERDSEDELPDPARTAWARTAWRKRELLAQIAWKKRKLAITLLYAAFCDGTLATFVCSVTQPGTMAPLTSLEWQAAMNSHDTILSGFVLTSAGELLAPYDGWKVFIKSFQKWLDRCRPLLEPSPSREEQQAVDDRPLSREEQQAVDNPSPLVRGVVSEPDAMEREQGSDLNNIPVPRVSLLVGKVIEALDALEKERETLAGIQRKNLRPDVEKRLGRTISMRILDLARKARKERHRR